MTLGRVLVNQARRGRPVGCDGRHPLPEISTFNYHAAQLISSFGICAAPYDFIQVLSCPPMAASASAAGG